MQPITEHGRMIQCKCSRLFPFSGPGRPPTYCPECITASTVVTDSTRTAKCPCGKDFPVKRMGRPPKFCPDCRPESDLRRARRQADYYAENVRTPDRDPIECAGGCGTIIELLRMGYKRKWCDECGAKRQARQQLAWALMHPEYLRGKWRRKKLRRRARMAGVEMEEFDYREVFERDRWTCQICSHKIDPDTPYIDPETGKPYHRYPTLDHVVPLAEGGAHTRANGRLACWICNSERGDRGGNEQLALI